MTDLTPDERTVLMIAAEGQSMIAIGRWEQPIDSCVAKGLMERADKFNNFISAKGRAALDLEDKADDSYYRGILETAAKVRNQRQQAIMSAEQAAQHLAYAARASAPATGDTLENAARQWSVAVLEKALEILK